MSPSTALSGLPGRRARATGASRTVPAIVGLTLILAAVISVRPAAAAGSTSTHLGTLSMRPHQPRVGAVVTISARTTGEVPLFPPFVVLQSSRLHPVTFPAGPCGGGQLMPVAHGQMKPVSVTPAGRHSLAAGVTWQMSFKIPKTMNRETPAGKSVRVATPPGFYYIVAIGAGMDGPCGPVVQSSTFVSVAKIHVLP